MAELGEGAAVSTTGKQDDWEFEARLTSVEFVSPIKVQLEKKEVQAPHWVYADRNKIKQPWKAKAKKLKLPQKVFYSKKPAVYSVKHTNPEVAVKIKVVKSKNVGGQAKIKGNLGALELEGECPTSAGEHAVKLKIVKKPKGIERFAGELALGAELDPPGISVPLNPAMAEVFFILANPAAMHARTGVPAEVLRYLVLRVGLAGREKPKDVSIEVAKFFHMEHNVKYDIEMGRTFYNALPPSGSISAFKLIGYLYRESKKVNCYDQAACVQGMAGAVGVGIQWIFMQPYGFINKTVLVGRKKPTNNPFYAAVAPPNNRRMIDPDNFHRTAFGNHAFCEYYTMIYDACAGPCVGTDKLADYIKNAIDHSTALNSMYTGLPGTTSDAKHYPGVTGIV